MEKPANAPAESAGQTIPVTPGSTADAYDLADRISYLQQTRFLQYATENLIQRFAEVMNRVEVPANTRIVEKGDEGDSMYFIVDGQVRVHDENLDIVKLGNGAVFGEIAALSPQQRTTSITADSDSVFYTINEASLYQVLQEQPEATKSIIQGLCDNESKFVKESIDRAVKVKVLERELEIGQRIQKGFLPASKPDIPGWDIEYYFKSAREVAGDFYDYFEIKSIGRIALIIGDVCDKGVGAALFMSLFRSLLRSSALSFDIAEWGNGNQATDAESAPEQVLTHCVNLVNQYVATTHARDSMFTSLFFALLDPANGDIRYINAGHEAPCLLNAQGEISRLTSTGPVVGLFSEAKFKVKSDSLGKGDVLLGFTDGLTEAKNSSGEELGEDRALEILGQPTNSLKDKVSALVSGVNGFTGSAKQFDDITLLAVKRHEFESNLKLNDGGKL